MATCTGCGSSLAPETRFCRRCGAAATEARPTVAAPGPPAASVTPADAPRAGSTGVARQNGPSEWKRPVGLTMLLFGVLLAAASFAIRTPDAPPAPPFHGVRPDAALSHADDRTDIAAEWKALRAERDVEFQRRYQDLEERGWPGLRRIKP